MSEQPPPNQQMRSSLHPPDGDRQQRCNRIRMLHRRRSRRCEHKDQTATDFQ
uniref:Uncharacterized protein n=1 Tax=Ascaris lumbricoides TaxID=6252 RepID=A0A9J2Q048_ASCLU